jgi:hypothetical protein
MREETVNPRILHRRFLASSLRIPPDLTASFTTGEIAALSIVANSVKQNSVCTFSILVIATLSATNPTIVRSALRTAAAERLIKRGARGIRIVSPKWQSWLRDFEPPTPRPIDVE